MSYAASPNLTDITFLRPPSFQNAAKAGVEVLPSGLQYRVLSPSMNLDGVTPNVSSMCHVHYRGTTVKGMEFDSSYKRGKPTKFRPTDVIKGWAEALQVCPPWLLFSPSPSPSAPPSALSRWTDPPSTPPTSAQLMREGDKWQVVVPAELAYGKRSMGEHITPGSVLVFEMELVQVEAEDRSRGIWGTLLGLVPKFVRDLPYALWVMLAYFAYNLITPAASGPRVRVRA